MWRVKERGFFFKWELNLLKNIIFLDYIFNIFIYFYKDFKDKL